MTPCSGAAKGQVSAVPITPLFRCRSRTSVHTDLSVQVKRKTSVLTDPLFRCSRRTSVLDDPLCQVQQEDKCTQ